MARRGAKLEELQRRRSSASGESEYLRDARRRGLDPESAAALPKRDEDPEEEDKFFYTKGTALGYFS